MTDPRPKVLVVDDDPNIRWLLAEVLEPHGFQVVTAENCGVAVERVTAESPAAVILDLMMPATDGMRSLERLKAMAPQVPVIMLTAHGDISTAVEAMQLGAYHYATKPFRNDDIVLIVQRAVEHHRLVTEVEVLRGQLAAGSSLKRLMGPSPVVDRVDREVQQVAWSNLAVLIQGETGTGKELVARAIHEQSPQRERPFIALDCGAISESLMESELFGHEKGAFTGAHRRHEGIFRLAQGGTLFLDEITNLAPPTQAKLLRVLQEKQVHPVGGSLPVPVDVRLLTASNVPLEKETRAGRFRQDLFYRVAEFVITLPPLRERCEDIPYLANRFLAEIGMELKKPSRGIAEDAAQLLLQYPWPGNVRELKNIIRRAAVLSAGVILPEHLQALESEGRTAAAGEPLQQEVPGSSLREMKERAAANAERQVIQQALVATHGNKTVAARLLRTDFKTLHLKMRRYALSAHDFHQA